MPKLKKNVYIKKECRMHTVGEMHMKISTNFQEIKIETMNKKLIGIKFPNIASLFF